MSSERAVELAQSVANAMRQFDVWVHFKAGARSEYSQCMRRAAVLSGVPLVMLGFANMGCLQECIAVAQLLREGSSIPAGIRSLETCGIEP